MNQENARKFIVSEIIQLPLIQEKCGRHLDETGAKKIFGRHRKFTEAQGCYVFGIRAGKGYKPVYVGKTTLQTLGEEVLSDGTVGKINRALLRNKKGTLVVAFVIPENKPGPNPSKLIDEVESVLIQYAYQKNPEIENENGIYQCAWFIDGVLNCPQGKPRDESRIFRRLVGITKRPILAAHDPKKKRQKKTLPKNQVGKTKNG